MIEWKSDLSYEMKDEFFQAVAMSVLSDGCTTWTFMKCLEKKLEKKYIKKIKK